MGTSIGTVGGRPGGFAPSAGSGAGVDGPGSTAPSYAIPGEQKARPAAVLPEFGSSVFTITPSYGNVPFSAATGVPSLSPAPARAESAAGSSAPLR